MSGELTLDVYVSGYTLLAAFPDARAVALPEAMPAIQSQAVPEYLEFWRGLFPGQIPEQPVLP
jgi:hypothetical protein